MRYLHYLSDENGEQIEGHYSNNSKPQLSMECGAEAQGSVYKIWDRETNDIIVIKKK